MSAWWSWALTAVGITGLYFAGQRRALGWAIGLSAQALWIAYAVATRQWGFIASAFAYGAVYARNFLSWRRPARVEPGCGRECSEQHTYVLPCAAAASTDLETAP